jgi:hypothetical protein
MQPSTKYANILLETEWKQNTNLKPRSHCNFNEIVPTTSSIRRAKRKESSPLIIYLNISFLTDLGNDLISNIHGNDLSIFPLCHITYSFQSHTTQGNNLEERTTEIRHLINLT